MCYILPGPVKSEYRLPNIFVVDISFHRHLQYNEVTEDNQ